MKTSFPIDSTARKEYPRHSGCTAYFPAALAGVARHSFLGNQKHNPGQPLHHARGKSTDHHDSVERHSSDLGDFLAAYRRGELTDVQVVLDEANALCWRALALSQELHEQYANAPLAPAARLPTPPPPPATDIPDFLKPRRQV